MTAGVRKNLVLVFSVLAGCSGSTGEATSEGDTGTLDTNAIDTSTVEDTFVRVDTESDAPDTADLGPSDVAGDAPPSWPSCESKPDSASASSIGQIWADNPAMPKFTWVSGAIVTGVSHSGCAADRACQIVVQEGSATTLAGAAKHAIKVFVSAKAASRFTGISVGDRLDLAAYAWRYNLGGQRELLLQVNDLLRGCAKKTGTGTIAAVPATLTELASVASYEDTYGPVLVMVADVSGRTAALTQTFGLWPTAGFDGGSMPIVSASPYYLTGAAFTAIAPSTRYDYASITGVYGLFVPDPGDGGTATKYLHIYPRSMADMVRK
jgi:hypothetical protein